VLVFSYGSPSSGIPDGWQATAFTGGVNRLDETDPSAVNHVARAVREHRLPGDRIVVSIHWGSNWGYDVSSDQRRLARGLIDEAGVDVVHGHSSHHPRPIEVYQGKLILYGCGDVINDYEGIGGHDAYRPELGFLYLADLDVANGDLQRLLLVPTRIRRFRINRAAPDEIGWLAQTMNREGRAFGTQVRQTARRDLELSWPISVAPSG
jgi:poly-gamma-glutamate synthesis protein (capsule biosynthesis protein)